MNIGFYAGSFDPFTNGHLHVIQTASKLFDKIIIGIGIHSSKTRRYDNEIMKQAIEKVLAREKILNVEVVIYSNLSVDVALMYHANFLIRGIRNNIDYRYEENMSQINEELSGLDTIYIRSGTLGFISSSVIVELLKNGKDVSKYLPPEIIEAIKKAD